MALSLKTGLDDIKADTTCPSCKDILKIFDKNVSETGFIDLVLRPPIYSDPEERESWDVDIMTMPNTYRDADVYLLKRSDYLTRLRNDSSTFNEITNLPLGLIRPWIKTCASDHECCQPNAANKLDMSLYLIDVIEECVTFMPVAKVVYMALSYVWGSVECTSLTLGSIEVLQKPQSLSSGSKVATIPRTIRDAMRLTADLGLRYLWVDCLCLVQDNPKISSYLNRMHLIYANAFLTTVVANKDNANGGITGYEDHSAGRLLPGDVINYPNHVLGMVIPRPDNPDPLPWCSRGWTLQEGFFSRRVLVISDTICLKCASGVVEEGADFGFERKHNLSKSIRPVLSSICQSPPDLYLMEECSQLNSDYDRWKMYSEVVETFAARRFSYERDVVKAFSGIISFFTRPYNCRDPLNAELLYGHPVRFLGNSLLWFSPEFTLRKRNILPRRDGSPTIPSWSWMAWQHGARSGLSDHFKWAERDRPVDLGISTVIHAQCSTCLQAHRSTIHKCSNKASLERINPESLQPYLHVRAQRAKFGILQDLKGDEGANSIWIRLGTMESEQASMVGKMIFDLWPPDLSLDGNGALDFVGLSTYKDRWAYIHVVALCIKPADNQPGVFERLGVAKIWKDAWDQVAQLDENIILG
ncbi:hypothetical protein G6011_08130 [Alternaria panax]|uniref:Heterokaryon incompatibility domain-containing protein n=1 Tax=Alternaria panax TaxID=48097 RepID=A0AAD4FHB2_9PLEO|nr:hypothetical protein G6011_08130 [Alternaria panax]